MLEKQRIDSGFYLHQAKLRNQKRKDEAKTKVACCNLGAMFAMDPTSHSSSSSSNMSDAECEIHHKKRNN